MQNNYKKGFVLAIILVLFFTACKDNSPTKATHAPVEIVTQTAAPDVAKPEPTEAIVDPVMVETEAPKPVDVLFYIEPDELPEEQVAEFNATHLHINLQQVYCPPRAHCYFRLRTAEDLAEEQAAANTAVPTEEAEPVTVCLGMLHSEFSDEQIAEFEAGHPHINIERANDFYLEGSFFLFFTPPPACEPPWS